MSKFTGNIIRLPAVTPTQNSASGVYTLDDQFTAQSSGTWPIVRDQYFNYTTLLLTGAVQGTAYPNPVTQPYSFLSDASTNNFVVSPNGDVSARPFNPYLNSYSNFFSGSGQYLTATNSSAFYLSTGNFTVEAWIYRTAASSGNAKIIVGQTQNTGVPYAGWLFYVTSSDFLRFEGSNGSAVTASITVPLNQWVHVAAVRASSTTTIYMNGVPLLSGSVSITDFSGLLTIGQYTSAFSGPEWIGYISNLRIVKGTAVYTSSFTPPTQPLQNISGTSLLTCQSNRFIDNSTANSGSGFPITVIGSPAVSQNSPFVSYDTTNGSGYFDNNGDYLEIANNAALQLGSSDFTLESWAYLIKKPTTDNHMVVSKQNYYLYYQEFSFKWTFETNFGSILSSSTWPMSEWQHVAVTRSGNTFTLWVNGTSQGTLNNSGSVTDAGGAMQIGQNIANSANRVLGYLANTRLVKGTAITPPAGGPTAPLTPVSGTSLLTLQTRAPATNNGFIDSSPNNFVVTRNGNTTQGSFSPFSPTGWSGYFSSISNYIRSTSNVSSITGDFTIECWVYWSSSTGSKIITALSADSIDLWINAPTGTITYYTGAATRITTTLTAPQNDWTHIALVRSSGVTTIYIDGTADSATYTSSATIGSGSEFLYIGRDSGTSFMAGYISNFRLVIGRAVYTSNFTPSITPLGNTTGGQNPPQGTETKLLTLQSNRFVDNASSGLGISVVGSPSVQAFSPFAPAQSYIPSQIGGSGYFDGTTDYLSSASNALLSPGSGDFTIEAWIYPTTSYSTYNAIYSPGSTTNGMFFGKITGGIGIRAVNTGDIISATAPSINQWVHVAVSRSGTSMRIFFNGVQQGSTVTDSTNFATSAIYVGDDGAGTANWNGYISNLRFVKGTAVYTANFTPPTAPLTAITNTSLLLNFTNGGIVDATGKNNLETVANSGVQTSQAKWSPGSMYFDGTTDYLKAPTSELWNLGSGDFAVEFFIRFNSIGAANNAIVGKWGSGAGTYAWIIQINSSQLIFYTGNNGTLGSQLTFAWTPSANIWYFVAVSRTSGNIRAYVDTNQIGTTQPNSHTLSSTAGLCAVGENLDGGGQSQFINGYLDDLRITRGYNRGYSGSTITVPPGPFPLG